MADELLQKEINAGRAANVIADPYSEGLYLAGLTDNQVNSYGQFFNNFYELKSKKQERQITRNALTMMKGAIFAIGTKKIGNLEWKEHCASSLREIFHEWSNGDMSSDFAQYYKLNGDGLTEEEKLFFRIFKNRYEYFSGVDHHESSKILFSLRTIKNDQLLKFEFCYKDETFINEVKDFFSALSKILEFVKK